MAEQESETKSSPLAYPPEYIAKLGPGSELDRLVHTTVFKLTSSAKKKVPRYSVDLALVIPALESYPFAIGRSKPGDQFYSDERPYWAGHADYDAIFTSSSPAIAACKALVYIAQIVDRQSPSQTDVGQ